MNYDMSGLAFTAMVCGVFFAAGGVKGVLGMGLPTLVMGMLGLFMPVAAAATLMAVPSLVTNVWQAAIGPHLRRLLRRLWRMQLGIAVATPVAVLLLPQPAGDAGRRLLGACLLLYGALGLLGWRSPPVSPRMEGPLGLAAGAATGLVSGLTGVFVLPSVPFLQSLGLAKDELSQGLGLCFSTSTLALVGALAAGGHVSLHASAASLLMVLPALAGMALGQAVRAAISEAVFRRLFFAGLVLLGAWLLRA